MASITFFLKEPNSLTTTPIIARVAHGGAKIKVYTGISVEPRKWIQAAQMLQTRGNNQAGRINDTLGALRARLEDVLLAHLATGVLPSAAQLRQALEPEAEPVLATETVPSRPDFWAAYQLWNEEQRGRVSPCTIKTNVTAANHLRNFAAHTRLAFDFDALTPAFATKFTSYLLHEARLTDNTIAKALTRLKCFLRFAHERGFVDRADFKFLKWKKQEPDILTLTLPEVQALEAVELTGALANVRNLFLLACYIGLRYSDLVALRPEHLQNERLRVRMHKTRDVVIILVRPAARQLLQRLFAGELRPISNQ
jgi:hypothetical protein